jgi:hypothetical protein
MSRNRLKPELRTVGMFELYPDPHYTSEGEFWFGWMAGRLTGVNKIDNRTLDLAFETPCVRWPVHYPTQLPGGQVVFQLGQNRICVLDPNGRQIALIAKGR